MLALLLSCDYTDVPTAHKGQLFDVAGAVCTGGDGLTGPALGPGSYWTGICDDVYTVECSTGTAKEAMTALTRDGVQFGLDVYVRYHAACDDATVPLLLSAVAPRRVPA